MSLMTFHENRKQAKSVLDFYNNYKKIEKEQSLCHSISSIRLDEYYNAVRIKKEKTSKFRIKNNMFFSKQTNFKDLNISDSYDFILLLKFICNKCYILKGKDDELKKFYESYIDTMIHSFAVNLKITDKVDSKFYPIGNSPSIEASFIFGEFLINSFELFKDLRILNQLIQLINLIDFFSFKYNFSGTTFKSFNLEMDFRSDSISFEHSYRFLHLFNKVNKILINYA